MFFSKITKQIPNKSVIKVKIKYDGLNFALDVQVLINAGILPKIKPIKMNFICDLTG